MLSLFTISIVVCSAIAAKAGKFYFNIRDRNLGYEEIIGVAILLGACINTCIDILNILAYPSQASHSIIKELAVLSRLTEALISYCIIEYVYRTSHSRLASKEK